MLAVAGDDSLGECLAFVRRQMSEILPKEPQRTHLVATTEYGIFADSPMLGLL